MPSRSTATALVEPIFQVALVLAKFFDETLQGQPTGSDLGIAGALTVFPMALIAQEVSTERDLIWST